MPRDADGSDPKPAKKGRHQGRRCEGGHGEKTGPRSIRGGGRETDPSFGRQPANPKAYGDAPVQAYIAAMPGWKSDIGRRLDALIVGTVPGVRKAVKWNSPFYGVEGPGEEQTWFLSFHCFTKYVKVTFFRGASSLLFRRARPSTRMCATSTSTRTSSTKPSSPPG
jgi:hypothetical protein